ncbi:hypothetical protein [Flaviaesturariibacter aridisoli]|uniref:Aromatic hydrocarbon degradation protein n=1 Tax=Flaviaesturariibacter aridisoli TaxID=2545761 RepID=A0A4R4DW40_9BACT|nr:hypothetical protein [Flaviaesturariibacter aridisoli]TCZ67895.1 hypothetical protein E0486_15130 [Flaviaesturariibacter aridisoli]
MSRTLGVSALALTASAAFAQGNSPYSRYGLGDLVSPTHISNRGMGGISAGDADFNHINFNNPASYSQLLGFAQVRNKKRLSSGRAIFDVGVHIDQRTLREPGRTDKFTASDVNLAYIQVGVPLRHNWGLVFGIRPISRVSYDIVEAGRFTNGDSIRTQFSGNGGAYLPSIGTGFSIGSLSLGANIGYLFGNRESNSERYFENDSVAFYQGLFRSNSSFGKIFFNFGAQYYIKLGGGRTDSASARLAKRGQLQFLRLGVAGNVRQSLGGTQNQTIGTFTFDPGGTLTDTVLSRKDVSGTVVYPSSLTSGFMLGGLTGGGASWTAGADVVYTKWSEYRFFGVADAVTDNMLFRAGAQIAPSPRESFFSRVAYRAGFGVGKDYITAGGELPYWSASAGFGFNLGHFNSQARNQATLVNLGFEYQNRGNNNSLLKENTFRLSIGLSLSDAWFIKRKYD